MNKTVNINLGGIFYHIDEDAYIKLSRYLEAIKKQLAQSEGMQEIISDIEFRISELFSERIKSDKQVITMMDLDQVIAIMGEPQDYRIDDEAAPNASGNFTQGNYTSKTKKLYRDKENNIFGGVCRGLSHYWGMDVVWVRLLMILLFVISQGTGILVYIIMWIVTPEAKTTSEKLEMMGEPVNISNIEKKVREEFESLSQKVNNIDYDKYKDSVQKGAQKVGSSAKDALGSIFRAIGKVIGIFMLVICVVSLTSLIVFLTSEFVINPDHGLNIIARSNFYNNLNIPLWIVGVLVFLMVGIPIIFLLVLSIKIILPNSKPFGKIINYSLLLLWIASIIATIVIGVKNAMAVAYQEKSVQKEYFEQAGDSLKIQLIDVDHDPYHQFHTVNVRLNDQNQEEYYSNKIKYTLYPTQDSKMSMELKRVASGNSLINAKERAEKIRYHYQFDGKILSLNNYITFDKTEAYKGQNLQVDIFVPMGKVFTLDESFSGRRVDVSAKQAGEIRSITATKSYKFQNNELICIDCVYNSQAESNSNPKTVSGSVSEINIDDEVNLNLKIGDDTLIIRTN